jgi:hypothetical protein
MAVLLNHVNLGLRIFIPDTGEIRQFDHGSLTIEEDDPAWDVVMAEAQANPNITVVMEAEKGRTVIAKASAAFACDACSPAQSFDSDVALAEHVNLIHIARPVLTDDGEALDTDQPVRTRRKRGEPEGIPPATAGRSG